MALCKILNKYKFIPKASPPIRYLLYTPEISSLSVTSSGFKQSRSLFIKHPYFIDIFILDLPITDKRGKINAGFEDFMLWMIFYTQMHRHLRLLLSLLLRDLHFKIFFQVIFLVLKSTFTLSFQRQHLFLLPRPA